MPEEDAVDWAIDLRHRGYVDTVIEEREDWHLREDLNAIMWNRIHAEGESEHRE